MQNGSTKEFNVALCGGGVVGGGVCRILKEREQVFEGFGLNFHVKWILVRNVEKKRDFEVPDGAKLTSDLQDILNDASKRFDAHVQYVSLRHELSEASHEMGCAQSVDFLLKSMSNSRAGAASALGRAKELLNAQIGHVSIALVYV